MIYVLISIREVPDGDGKGHTMEARIQTRGSRQGTIKERAYRDVFVASITNAHQLFGKALCADNQRSIQVDGRDLTEDEINAVRNMPASNSRRKDPGAQEKDNG